MCIIISANYIIIIIIRVNSWFYSTKQEGFWSTPVIYWWPGAKTLDTLIYGQSLYHCWDIHSCLMCRIYRFYQRIVGSISRDNQILHFRDVSDANISRSADADAYANICAWRSAEADAHTNIKGWRSVDANADANIRARRSADANADANICNIIIIYHDFLSTPRRGSHSHVKSDKTHTKSSRNTP